MLIELATDEVACVDASKAKIQKLVADEAKKAMSKANEKETIAKDCFTSDGKATYPLAQKVSHQDVDIDKAADQMDTGISAKASEALERRMRRGRRLAEITDVSAAQDTVECPEDDAECETDFEVADTSTGTGTGTADKLKTSGAVRLNFMSGMGPLVFLLVLSAFWM